MSYDFYRDNPQLLVGGTTRVDHMPGGIAVRFEMVASDIRHSHRAGLHVDQCGCDRGWDCPLWPHDSDDPGPVETMCWLYVRGLLPVHEAPGGAS